MTSSGSGRAQPLSLLIQKALAGHQPTDGSRVRCDSFRRKNQSGVHASALVASDKITTKITRLRRITWQSVKDAPPQLGCILSLFAALLDLRPDLPVLL